MFEGLTTYAALLVALAICIVRPGLTSAALVLIVGAAIIGYEISRPNEDGNQAEEKDGC